MNDQTPNQTPINSIIRNDDGNSLADLMPPFPIPNILGYLDELDAIGVLDAHDELTIMNIDLQLETIEAAAIALHELDPSRHADWLAAIIAIAENSRDLTAD